MLNAKYGKGAEIYPPTNNKDVFTLADSFPNSMVPPIAKAAVSRRGNNEVNEVQEDQNGNSGGDRKELREGDNYALKVDTTSNDEKQNTSLADMKAKLLWYITKAKEADKKTQKSSKRQSAPSLLFNRLPIITAISMCVLDLHLISPSEILWVVFFSGYLIMLGLLSSSTKSMDSNNPLLPNLPPQGHVPALLKNPLGVQLTGSFNYQNWLKMGVVLGYILPCIAVGWYKVTNQLHLARICAKSVFFISCQIITEKMTRKVFAPLPLRILVPLAYNSIRMVWLYDWIMFPGNMAKWGRVLASLNFVYWGLNLFGFLLPVATMRYMRSHFFCVEAEEVVLREQGF